MVSQPGQWLICSGSAYPPQTRMKLTRGSLGARVSKLAPKNESLGYPLMETAWSYGHQSSHGTSMWRTDGRTDGRTNRPVPKLHSSTAEYNKNWWLKTVLLHQWNQMTAHRRWLQLPPTSNDGKDASLTCFHRVQLQSHKPLPCRA